MANWSTHVADNRAIPVDDACADLAIEGWSFGHTVSWEPESWRQEIGKMIAEMLRVLRPGGTAIVIETLGTGNTSPGIPTDGLGAYYAWLEWEHGFAGRWVRTDIAFRSVEEAERLTRFFFGDWLAGRVLRENMATVPECTGLWWRRK
jgi:ubiquinone/menaquinone biosynthesis C-methylase UbiE